MNAATPLHFETGIVSRVPWDDYAAIDATSSSRLKNMKRSGQHYLHALMAPKESEPLTLGKATHCAVLEPERFASDYAVWGERLASGRLRPRNGRDWEAFQTLHAGREILKDTDAELAFAMQKAVRGSAAAMRYLEQGDAEVTLRWLLGGRQCKGRVDWLTREDGKPTLVGLKTARDCRHLIFGAAAARYQYHWQWAFYSDGYFTIKGINPKVVEIVVESEAPHAVAVYTIDDDILSQGRDEYEQALKQLAECESTGHFPGPQDIEEPLTLPSWCYEHTDDISGLGLEL